ncbi:SDR family NAD(P)-dependent oxidoreductase (plasmid) [Deinococcus metallilatus]|uniref:SDR family oxidoreductase n=1 Tax=Deinococcus metallilatus TaxID=1211322 RepID=A0AAJ5F7K6_9DEIO|nr:SDR family oxidoreductase [Deinococcus metallilatus]MBB5293193.1 short-subunit dehydrogenase [Deinococcus metallilatus]QBY06986.1 SDR family NAD(P)-dependent oxidoreductase [Deinococcus metallilatus]RXJ17997.1 SDR family NAD(P)-dependent oxidoreductase [Deinococcus metallilatus]TLK31933.1 SDR family oxidoreductase [Deinococcus metallilatus]GMA15582.1 short-chain dehydrogenase [Deinococcus metallilatus]
MKLKPLDEQVMVLTGASSGIGLTTARMAAKQGVRLVLAARSENALRQLTQELVDGGGQAVFAVCDVSREEDVQKLAELARATYGGCDTWVNNAGVGMYGTLLESSVEDMRRLFDINFWGIVYGSRAAVALMRERGGALINMGSVTSEQTVPLQSLYSASKHAVKGFTDGLRMELEHDGVPIAVTLIKPGPIDTPFPLNARSYLPTEPQHVPPVYAPETVARAVLHAAATPTRETYVGGGAKGIAASGEFAPHATEKALAAAAIPRTLSDRPPLPPERNILYHPSERLEERGDYPGVVQPVSVYTEAATHRKLLGAGLLGAGLAAALWHRSRRA